MCSLSFGLSDRKWDSLREKEQRRMAGLSGKRNNLPCVLPSKQWDSLHGEEKRGVIALCQRTDCSRATA